MLDTLQDTRAKTKENQPNLQPNPLKAISAEQVNERSWLENFIMDYVLRFGAWALQPRNLEVIIAYAVCILFLVIIGFLSVYLTGLGSEYQ